jgi:hypothetical protein
MQQAQTMTLDEKLSLSIKAGELKKAGKIDEYERLMKSLPMPPYLAKFAKEKIGVDFLLQGGWNLTEADTEYGHDWLTK